MANVVFSRLKSYSSVIPQSVLLGRFVELNSNPLFFSFAYAKRLENITFILSRYPSHSLRRDGASSTILQQAQTPLVAPALCQSSSTEDRLCSFRSDPGSFVYYHGRSSKNQQTEILQYNGVFLSLLGFSKFPDQSTLRRFLKRLPPKTIR